MNSFFKLPNGYIVGTRDIKCSYDEAYNILRSHKQIRFARAILHKDFVILQKDTWICPVCGNICNYNNCRKRPANEVKAEMFSQRELLSNEETYVLSLQTTEHNHIERYCRKCKSYIMPNTYYDKISILLDNNKLKISRLIENEEQLSEIMDSDYCDLATFSLPLVETLLFDFNINEASLYLPIDGVELGRVKDCNSIFTYHSTLIKSVSGNPSVRRAIHRALMEIWKPYELPFSSGEVSVELLLKIVQFSKFPFRKFYEAIPFEEDKVNIYECFTDVAKGLSDYERIDKTFAKTDLPKIKSVKRLVFNRPQLLFYEKPICFLNNLLKDTNLLCRILKSDFCYKLLFFVITEPRIAEPFFSDYVNESSAKVFTDEIISDMNAFIEYGRIYNMVNDDIRKRERAKFKNEKISSLLYDFKKSLTGVDVPFALPLQEAAEEFNCEIDGYEFVTLTCKQDYLNAARDLNNCLDRWTAFNNPVIIVKHKNMAVAAVEIENSKRLKQAYEKNNEPLNEELEEVISAFCKKFRITSF